MVLVESELATCPTITLQSAGNSNGSGGEESGRNGEEIIYSASNWGTAPDSHIRGPIKALAEGHGNFTGSRSGQLVTAERISTRLFARSVSPSNKYLCLILGYFIL